MSAYGEIVATGFLASRVWTSSETTSCNIYWNTTFAVCGTLVLAGVTCDVSISVPLEMKQPIAIAAVDVHLISCYRVSSAATKSCWRDVPCLPHIEGLSILQLTEHFQLDWSSSTQPSFPCKAAKARTYAGPFDPANQHPFSAWWRRRSGGSCEPQPQPWNIRFPACKITIPLSHFRALESLHILSLFSRASRIMESGARSEFRV